MQPRTSLTLTVLAVAVLALVVALVRRAGPAPGAAPAPVGPAALSQELRDELTAAEPEPPPEARERVESAGAAAEPIASAAGGVAETIVLTGRVVAAETRRPLAGAWVERVTREDDERAPLRVVCDAGGEFELEAPREDVLDRPGYAGDPRPRKLSLRAGADGFPARWFHFADPGPEGALELELALPRGELVRGRVLDLETRAPIEGAEVRGSILSTSDETRSGADGTFELRVAPGVAASWVWVDAIAPGWCRGANPADLPGHGAEADVLLLLPRATWVEGHVLDATGAPVAGAEVRVGQGQGGDEIELERDWGELLRARGIELAGANGVASAEHGDEPVTTDEGGRFRAPDQLPWRDGVVVCASLTDGRVASALVERLGAPGEETRVELVLGTHHGVALVRGRMTLNGEPVTRGSVLWRGPTRAGGAELDGAGRFLLVGVEPGRVELQPMPHIDAMPFSWVEDQEVALELAAGEVREQTIALEHERATISGRVLHAGGSPRPGVFIGARDEAGAGSLAATTDADGRYVLEVPDASATYEVVAAIGGVRVTRAGVRAGSEDVDILLPPLGSVRLRPVDAVTGEPLAPISDAEWRPVGEREYRRALPDSSAPDGQGRRVYTLPAGRVDLLVHAGRSGYVHARADGFVVGEGEERELTLRLEPGLTLEVQLAEGVELPPRECSLIVLEEDAADRVERAPEGFPRWLGHPELPGMALLHRELRFSSRTLRATVNGLAPGRYRLRAFPDELELEPATVELDVAGPRELELRWRTRAAGE